jgi:hypothetical protein
MSVAVVWGWYGVGGAVAMLLLGLLAAGAAWVSRAESTWQPVWRQLAGSWRSLLAIVFAGLLAFGSVVSFVGALSASGEHLTIKRLRTGVFTHRNGVDETEYYVQDTRGREFVANKATYRRLDEGDVVDCEIVRPPGLPARLQSCAVPER